MASNNGGPWGGRGGPRGTGGDRGSSGSGGGGGRRPGEQGSQIPEIDEMVRRGQERLRAIMGGRGGGRGGNGGSGGPAVSRGMIGLGALVLFVVWLVASVYSVRPDERSVELFLGDFSSVGEPGLNFAPWPVVTHDVIQVTTERVEDLGVRPDATRGQDGLMLTTDENIVDVDFQVVWNVSDPAQFLFNLRDPEATVRAVAESVMREIIARSELAPILNVSRAEIAQQAEELIQDTLNGYDAGINVVRVNLNRADPPQEVIDSFREVQAAEQERDRLQRQADAYANRVLAGARGDAAQVLEEAEGYRARVVNEARGEASRFEAVLTEYSAAPEVTRKRLYLETMEQVLGRVEKVILDENGQGVVPYLPLNELNRNRQTQGQAASPAAAGEAN